MAYGSMEIKRQQDAVIIRKKGRHMNGKLSMLYSTAVIGLLMSGAAFAQDNSGEIKELRKEVQGLRNDIKGMRGDINKAIAAMKSKPAARPKQQRPAMTMIGKKPSVHKLTTIDGQAVTVGGKRDKPQVVFCYASWCGFCKKALPWMDEVQKKYKDQGVQVLALNLDQRGEGGRARTEKQTEDHFRGLNYSLPMAMTTSTSNTAKLGVELKARSFPTLFVIGASGVIESVHVGAKAGLANIIGKELDLLLAGKNRTSFPK